MHDLPERRKNARAAEEYRAGGRSTEESEDKSAKWSGEDTEESALEEENMITGGAGEAGRPLTLMTGESAVNNARDGTQGAASGRSATADTTSVDADGATADTTSVDADEAEASGRNGARFGERERVAGSRENLDGKSSVVVDKGGKRGLRSGSQALRSEVGRRMLRGLLSDGKPWGDRQGVGGGVETPQVIDTPVVDEFPQGGETPRGATDG